MLQSEVLLLHWCRGQHHRWGAPSQEGLSTIAEDAAVRHKEPVEGRNNLHRSNVSYATSKIFAVSCDAHINQLSATCFLGLPGLCISNLSLVGPRGSFHVMSPVGESIALGNPSDSAVVNSHDNNTRNRAR